MAIIWILPVASYYDDVLADSWLAAIGKGWLINHYCSGTAPLAIPKGQHWTLCKHNQLFLRVLTGDQLLPAIRFCQLGHTILKAPKASSDAKGVVYTRRRLTRAAVVPAHSIRSGPKARLSICTLPSGLWKGFVMCCSSDSMVLVVRHALWLHKSWRTLKWLPFLFWTPEVRVHFRFTK